MEQSEVDMSPLDRITAHALDYWCVPCVGRPDGVPGDGDTEVRCAIHDDNFKALYQLWYLWGKEEGRSIDDAVFAQHFGSLVLAGAVMPILAWDGTLPVATATMVLQFDPWDGALVAYGDHAWTHPDYRGTGCLYQILEQCAAFAEIHDADKIVMPIAAKFDWEKYKPWYESTIPGWEVYSRILVNHRKK